MLPGDRAILIPDTNVEQAFRSVARSTSPFSPASIENERIQRTGTPDMARVWSAVYPAFLHFWRLRTDRSTEYTLLLASVGNSLPFEVTLRCNTEVQICPPDRL